MSVESFTRGIEEEKVLSGNCSLWNHDVKNWNHFFSRSSRTHHSINRKKAVIKRALDTPGHHKRRCHTSNQVFSNKKRKRNRKTKKEREEGKRNSKGETI